MASAEVGVLFLIALTASLANGSSSGKDVSQRREVEAIRLSRLLPGQVDTLSADASGKAPKPCSACDPPGARKRSKRCTCYTYKDKECVYYCHLDIIWINTPEHTVPYGMSSYQGALRMRRSVRPERGRSGVEAKRCVCTLQTDSGCSNFCIDSSQTLPPLPASKTDKRTATGRRELAVKSTVK
ncbi:Endothelin-3 [Channa argus]|uniref:Endothelin-3 n=1 Tax=Channa argus TaxID=215402 RepID=A0A6G1PH79_CHAAH|nr:Endothelin-3 [Channa argus]